MSRSSVIVLAVTAAFAASVIWTARARRIAERHSFAWLAVAALVGALAVWRRAIDEIAAAMGIYYPPSALFFVAGGAVLWLVYRQSLEIAEQRRRMTLLAQEFAVLAALVSRNEPRSTGAITPTSNDRIGS